MYSIIAAAMAHGLVVMGCSVLSELRTPHLDGRSHRAIFVPTVSPGPPRPTARGFSPLTRRGHRSQ